MCGIVGFVDWHEHDSEELRQIAVSMSQCLTHRGPDDEGVWVDASAGLALAHRRLSIVDLSPSGHQPMRSSCGRFTVVYNGEIYNHQKIRRELETSGGRFRGTCDTEVLLEAISIWGLDETLRRLVGMFAFAVWDGRERKLTLVRDALGIKPLYHGWMSGCLLFASELKALRKHPAFRGQVDRRALALYLRYGYIPAPHSIYQGIGKLAPGSCLTVTARDADGGESRSTWWSMQDAVSRGIQSPFPGTPEEAVVELDHRLRDAVALRMKADVPWGAFLSGGVDSSTVVALMQSQSDRRVATFSIGFEESDYDETPYAKAVAEHLRTDHTEFRVTPDEARATIPRLPELYDEPFADVSQIPTLMVSQLARQNVKVCLSGDGGDELYCGYDRYHYIRRLWARVAWCPPPLRRLVSRSSRVMAGWFGAESTWHRKLNSLSDLTCATDRAEFYQRFSSHWRHPERLITGMGAGSSCKLPRHHSDRRLRYLEQMMYIDSVSYLPDDILVKVDRASMAVALEVRVPMLDHRLVEFAWSLPLSVKNREGTSKWILRRVLERYVPRSLTDRPKMGFGVPIGNWLRGPLRLWAEALLAPERLHAEGYFLPEPITRKWEEHLSGQVDWQYLLWDILMFQVWLEAQAV